MYQPGIALAAAGTLMGASPAAAEQAPAHFESAHIVESAQAPAAFDLAANNPVVTIARRAEVSEGDPEPTTPDEETTKQLGAYCIGNNQAYDAAVRFNASGRYAKFLENYDNNEGTRIKSSFVAAQDTETCAPYSTRQSVTFDVVQVTPSSYRDVTKKDITITGPEMQTFGGRGLVINTCRKGVESRRLGMRVAFNIKFGDGTTKTITEIQPAAKRSAC